MPSDFLERKWITTESLVEAMRDTMDKTEKRVEAREQEPSMTKVTVNLPSEAVAALRELAEKRKTTMTEVLRSAIVTEKFLSEKSSAGAKILVQEKDNSVKQVVFSQHMK